jgi:hypothetical protein
VFVPRVALRPRTIVSARAVAITLLPCRSFRRERSGRSALGGTITGARASNPPARGTGGWARLARPRDPKTGASTRDRWSIRPRTDSGDAAPLGNSLDTALQRLASLCHRRRTAVLVGRRRTSLGCHGTRGADQRRLTPFSCGRRVHWRCLDLRQGCFSRSARVRGTVQSPRREWIDRGLAVHRGSRTCELCAVV